MTERDLQKNCTDILDKLLIRYRHKHNNQHQQKYRKPAHDKEKGFPDLEIYFRNKVVFIEFKLDYNDLSDKQIEWKNYLEWNDYKYYVIKDVDSFNEVVNIYKGNK